MRSPTFQCLGSMHKNWRVSYDCARSAHEFWFLSDLSKQQTIYWQSLLPHLASCWRKAQCRHLADVDGCGHGKASEWSPGGWKPILHRQSMPAVAPGSPAEGGRQRISEMPNRWTNVSSQKVCNYQHMYSIFLNWDHLFGFQSSWRKCVNASWQVHRKSLTWNDELYSSSAEIMVFADHFGSKNI